MSCLQYSRVFRKSSQTFFALYHSSHIFLSTVSSVNVSSYAVVNTSFAPLGGAGHTLGKFQVIYAAIQIFFYRQSVP